MSIKSFFRKSSNSKMVDLNIIYNNPFAIAKEFCDITFNSIVINPLTKDVYVGTNYHGVFKFDGEKWEKVIDDIENIKTITCDKKGNVWIGTWGNGVIKLNTNSRQLTYYKARKDELNSNFIHSITIDERNNDIWFATMHGVTRLHYIEQNIPIWINDYGKSLLKRFANNPMWDDYVNVYSIAVDNNNNIVFMSIETGQIICYDINIDSYKICSSKLPKIFFENNLIIDELNNILWIGCSKGIIKFDINNDEYILYNTENSPIPKNDIVAIAYDKINDVIWGVVSANGVVMFDVKNNTWAVYNTKNSELISNHVHAIAIGYDNNNTNVWIVSSDGVNRFDVSRNSWVSYNVKDILNK